jgi:hypothetical protein
MSIAVGEIYINRYSQKVKVSDVNDIDVVVEFIGENYVDLVDKQDFIENFKRVKNEKEKTKR